MKTRNDQAVEDFLRLEVKNEGDLYVIDINKLLDLTDIDNAINTTAANIAFLDKTAAILEQRFEDLQAEYQVWWADADAKVRAEEVKGEEKIKAVIRRDPEWLEWQKEINQAKADWTIVRGHSFSTRTFAHMLEVKCENMRKFPEICDDVGTLQKRLFSIIKKDPKRTPVK